MTTSNPHETKHTPGPWHSFQQADGTRYLIVHGDGKRPNEPVLAHVSSYLAAYTTQDEANARLISAAPDLLEACKDRAADCGMGQTLRCLADMLTSHGIDAKEPDWMDFLKSKAAEFDAAIAKATK